MRENRSKQTFSFEAPEAHEVLLAGDFTGWEQHPLPLKKNRSGTWTAAVSLPPGKHQYRFLVDALWSDDPDCATRVQNGFGTENCVRIVTEAPRGSARSARPRA